jgi:hypothetical protein
MNFLYACLSAWTCSYMRKNRGEYDPTTYKIVYALNWVCGFINIIIWLMGFYEN